MRVLEGLEPNRVFYYFEEICGIPHGSDNVEKISNYLVNFAKEHGLSYVQDEAFNVIICKPASEGYENEPGVIMQGHMDMVAVKKPESSINMLTDGLKVCTEGDRIYAEDTSLGGDDGIAVAYSLAILEDDNIKHPALTVVITTNEETGMDGARAIDLSQVTAKRLLNLDSEEEGIFLTGCAGGGRLDCRIPVNRKSDSAVAYRISVEGLAGGHSGEEIHKERGNSNIIFGRILRRLSDSIPVMLKAVEGGLADNAIPRQTVGVVLVKEEDRSEFEQIVMKTETDIQKELATKDPDFRVTTVCMGEESGEYVTPADTRRVARYLTCVPNGVQAMSADVAGLVETSLNMGIMKLVSDGESLRTTFSVRSSIGSSKYALIDKVTAIVEMCGGTYNLHGEYPGWAYRVDSPLRDKMVRIYEEMYGKTPMLRAIHAGLECGLFSEKIKDLDCVSIGPDMKSIHTTEEELSISSTKRVWEFVLRVLETKD